MLPLQMSITALPWKSPVTSTPATHAAHFHIVQAGVEIIPENYPLFKRDAQQTPWSAKHLCLLPVAPNQLQWWGMQGGLLLSLARIKFWQDDGEDGYPAQALQLRRCRLPQQPAQRRLRTRPSQGRDEISHAESAGADPGGYGAGRGGSCSQERLLCPWGRAEPNTGHCWAPRHGQTLPKRLRVYGSSADI